MALQSSFDFDESAPFADAPTRAAGLSALKAFVPSMGRIYREERNFDRGPGRHQSVSQLSPYIRRRLVTEDEAVRAALGAHAPSTCEKFVQEVFWRGYFKGWLEHRPSVWADYRLSVEDDLAALEGDDHLRAAYEDAVQGRTGLAPFDAWARELVETGYLHNHARMWFASIWIFTLRLPWRLGADFFLRHLLDGDPASNTLSWRWVAGLHTRGKNYVARASNIAKFTEGRFRDAGPLADDPAPLDRDENPEPAPIPPGDIRPGADEPYAFIVTDEDCAPESLALRGTLEAAAGLVTVDALSPNGVAAAVRDFAMGAVRDGIEGLTPVNGETPIFTGVDALVAWAKGTGVKDVIAAYVPVGPTADALAQARRALDGEGIRLRLIRRAYDDAVWPHASKGFFGLKKRIPNLIRDLDLGPAR